MQQMIITLFIKLIIGSDVFNKIQQLVDRWADGQLSGKEKRHGVLAEAESIGIKAAQWIVRISIELAVAKLNKYIP